MGEKEIGIRAFLTSVSASAPRTPPRLRGRGRGTADSPIVLSPSPSASSRSTSPSPSPNKSRSRSLYPSLLNSSPLKPSSSSSSNSASSLSNTASHQGSVKPRKMTAPPKPAPIHPFFTRKMSSDIDSVSHTLSMLTVNRDVSSARGKLVQMSIVPPASKATSSWADTAFAKSKSNERHGAGLLSDGGEGKLSRTGPLSPKTSPGSLFRIVPHVSGIQSTDGARLYSTSSTGPTIPGTFRPGTTTPPRMADLGTAGARRGVTTATTPPRVSGGIPNIRGEEPSEDGSEDLDDLETVSSVKTEAAEPLVLHPGGPRVTYDPSLATAEVITEPHELTTPLPFFSYRDPSLRGSRGFPNVVYTSSAEEADDLVGCLRGDILGLDLEWPPPGQGAVRVRTGKNGEIIASRDPIWVGGKPTWPQGRTSVIQLYDGHTAIVFHMMGRTTPGPGLVRLLADPTRLKVGVAVRGDALKLVRDFPACAANPPAGILELTRVARAIEPQRWKSRASLVALAKLCQGYLGLDVHKGQVRYGAWNERLDQEQIDYAVNDVVISYLLYEAIMARATALGMSLDAREFATRVPGRPVHSVTGAQPATTTTIPVTTAPAPAAAPTAKPTSHVPSSSTTAPGKPDGVPTEHYTTYTEFVAGREISDLASSLSVKETVIQNQILATAQNLPIETLSSTTRHRLLTSITRGSWVATKYASYISRVRKSLEEAKVV